MSLCVVCSYGYVQASDGQDLGGITFAPGNGEGYFRYFTTPKFPKRGMKDIGVGIVSAVAAHYKISHTFGRCGTRGTLSHLKVREDP